MSIRTLCAMIESFDEREQYRASLVAYYMNGGEPIGREESIEVHPDAF